MSKRLLACCLALVMAAATQVAAQDSNANAPLRVLFIGNSFTAINDLPRLTAELAASARPPRMLETRFVGEGGATLKRHWEAGRAIEAIRTGKWDYVVLQDQGALGWYDDYSGVAKIGDPKAFHEYSRLFDAEIRRSGARTVFFMTWARQDAPQTQAALTHAYASIADELKALLAPVGIAWQRALEARPGLVLHHADKSHPGPDGSYLAASTLYATLFSRSPEGLARAHLSGPDAAFLQRVAGDAAADKQLLAAPAPAAGGQAAPGITPAVPPAADAQALGLAVFAAAQKAAGGVERLRALRDYAVDFSSKVRTPMGEMALEGREVFVFPGVIRTESRHASGKMESFFDGTGGWRMTPQGVQDLPERMKRVSRGQAIRNTLNLLRGEGEFKVRYEKRHAMGASRADVITVTKEGESLTLFVDAESGLILRKAYRGAGTGGIADLEESYSDYREVGGVRVPFLLTMTQNGAPFIEATVKEVRLDTGANPAELAKKPD